MSPRGRRPGGEDTRALILAAARAEFAARGYARASIRGIARTAEVDPRLVHHYFGGKSQLFAAVMDVPVDPSTIVGEVVGGDVDEIGERIVRAFLTIWDSPANQPALVGLIRSGLGDEEMVGQFREFLVKDMVGKIIQAHPGARALPPRERQFRAGLIVAQMIGLALARYVLRVPGLADAPIDAVVARIGPIIQAHLDRA